MQKSTYGAEDIEVLKGIEPVRRRPGMYTDTSNPNHLAQEVIDNSVDEALAGHADTITITLHPDNIMSVEDNGRGIPTDVHPELKLPAVEVILATLHAGGKFNNENYAFSGGLHGVGISVVNALSLRVDVDIYRDGLHQHIAFENGERAEALSEKGKIAKKKTGTLIRFKPDTSYFDDGLFIWDKIVSGMQAKSVFCRGVTFILKHEAKNEEQVFINHGTLEDYCRAQSWHEASIGEYLYHIEREREGSEIELCAVWAPDSIKQNSSFVNMIETPLHGTHVNGLRAGLYDAVLGFADIHNSLPKGVKISAEDVFKDVQYILSVKLPDPQFASQTKERLSSREVTRLVQGIVKDSLVVAMNENIDVGHAIVARTIENAQARVKTAQKVERKKAGKVMALPGKLADCTTRVRDEAELFLVEGDSAGGSAKQARNRETQAIMPLRGKILNTWEISPSDLFSNKEVSDIATAIGVDPNSDDLSGLRYGKICVLCDADSDGYHIATLLVCLFVKHFRPLLEQGNVFIAMPPLYRIDIGKNAYYALDDNERQEIIKIHDKRGNAVVQRFKGLGEMNPSQLRDTTMKPESRRLIQLGIEDGMQTDEIMSMLLAKKRAGDRYNWLQESALSADVVN